MATKRKQSGDSEPSKKQRRSGQVYIQSYTEKYPFIDRGSTESYVKCTICDNQFSISSGGVNDIKRHVEGPKHVKKTEILEQSKKIVAEHKPISAFFPAAPSDSKMSSFDMDVIRAETMLVDLTVELNLPMAALDKLNTGVKKMFPDSKIAKQFSCARSKGTAIVKEIAAKTTISLAERMKLQPFTISTDGSNDKGGVKLFPLIVRTIDPDKMEVRSDALSVPSIEGSATGEKIFGLIEAELMSHKIPWDNCLALGCDNANVMVGKEAGVFGRMKKKHPDLYLSGCVCHLIHIAAEKGAGYLPFSPSQLLIDVYYYLDKSSCRQSSLKMFQVLHNLKEDKMLKHVTTRWLSIGKCLPRVITSWNALYDFFSEEEKNVTASAAKKKAGDLKKVFASRRNKLFCLFLVDIIKVFEDINTTLQSDKPMIHVLKNELQKFFRELLVRFVKPSAMLNKEVMDVDFSSQVNIKSKADLIIGEQARIFVAKEQEKNPGSERLEDFFSCVFKFFKASCSYIKEKLPLSDALLSHAAVVDPSKQVDSSFGDLEYFLKRFPKLLPSGVTTSDLQLEFAKYQCTDISKCIQERGDSTWFAISKLKEGESFLFPHLPKVMLSIMTIPHSSAHCERIFSVVRKNKTDFRGSMGQDTLEALVVAKSRPGHALDRHYSAKELMGLKSAYYQSLSPQ